MIGVTEVLIRVVARAGTLRCAFAVMASPPSAETRHAGSPLRASTIVASEPPSLMAPAASATLRAERTFPNG